MQLLGPKLTFDNPNGTFGPAMDVDVVDGFEFRSHACSKIAATLLGCKLSRPCGNQK